MDKQIKDFDKYIKGKTKELAGVESDIASQKKTKANLQTEINTLTDKKLHIKSYLDKKEEELTKSVKEREAQAEAKLKEVDDVLADTKEAQRLANRNLKDTQTEKDKAASVNATAEGAKQEAERVVNLVKKCKSFIDDVLSEV